MDANLSNEDRIRKALNDAQKQRLAERYGASFSAMDSSLPPEIEAQWLNNIEEFERQYEAAKTVTIREFLGDPPIRRLDDIPPGLVRKELLRVMAVMADKNVYLDFEPDVPPETIYLFLTTRFLDHEMDDIRIEGMEHHFIYEEFLADPECN